ncbi:hypothetical protein JIN77_15665 [Verrucomicrobiaceae bacterium R5-34]|uniref:Uncharacterized protein n=1 Tax=Oceaniferula flava TaxID=2800421 RepID=A0AAE2VCM2_9BACT|nr:hypothetical protein [Oceaniferula flavus]MBK1832175.1 hypothetical protein [Verrucomicrobiaceae bacterium R5-34]MBK1855825.1 hypothetical protein [Oceaniferula flavus]MBM1137132.1 hypothetical protein [Oceaniferula flavus]
MSDSEHDQDQRDFGPQPLDRMMDEWGIGNHDMVEVSTEQLTHKQVQKARKGRRLTLKMMQKVTRAFNVAIWHRLDKEQKEAYYEYMHRDLFSYAKGYDADWVDPNAEIAAAVSEQEK